MPEPILPPESAADAAAADAAIAHSAESAPPAAAVTVLNGRSEREIALERELTDERRVRVRTEEEKKARETRIMELEDELKRLKFTPAEPKRPAFDPFNFLNS